MRIDKIYRGGVNYHYHGSKHEIGPLSLPRAGCEHYSCCGPWAEGNLQDCIQHVGLTHSTILSRRYSLKILSIYFGVGLGGGDGVVTVNFVSYVE